MKFTDIVISFDTTGSMYPVLREVRRNIKNLTHTLFKDIPKLRISIIAHGDYYDAGNPYTLKYLDFCTDPNEICEFIENVESTYGGDAPECYELVLRIVNSQLHWNKDANKILVMIGDDVPHEPSYPQNRDNIDWTKELAKLRYQDIKVYAVHAMPECRRHSKSFYRTSADVTGGLYLTLDQFADINDLILGICYKQSNEEQLNQFITKIQPTATRAVRRNIATLTGEKFDESAFDSYPSTTSSRGFTPAMDIAKGLTPVPSGRFQVFEVWDKTPIKQFVQSQGITFKLGRGFYELTKPEDVQQYKEIILMNRRTGDFFNGTDARKILGLLPQSEGGRGTGTTERLRPVSLETYRVFIQSTSVNRALMPDTGFLYEVEDWDMSSSLPISPPVKPVPEKPKTKTTRSKKIVKEDPPKEDGTKIVEYHNGDIKVFIDCKEILLKKGDFTQALHLLLKSHLKL